MAKADDDFVLNLKDELDAPTYQEQRNLGIPEELRGQASLPPQMVRPPVYESSFIDYKKFIEDNFMVRPKEVDNEMGFVIPFKFNKVQNLYYDRMRHDYPKMDGLREIILKARQQGFSTMILAMFVVDFITKPNSVSICISHRSKETKLLFKRVRFFIESYCTKHGFDIKDYLSVDTKEELENATNGAYFYIGTAGSKVGGRGDTVTNIHFSEAAFYQETEKVDAKEIIEATSQQVPMDHGMIFIESTGGHYGSYYQGEWERAKSGDNNLHPRFFGWQELYTREWIDRKHKEFSSEDEFKSHYPEDESEAFLYSGSPFFDRSVLVRIAAEAIDPITAGRLAADGGFI